MSKNRTRQRKKKSTAHPIQLPPTQSSTSDEIMKGPEILINESEPNTEMTPISSFPLLSLTRGRWAITLGTTLALLLTIIGGTYQLVTTFYDKGIEILDGEIDGLVEQNRSLRENLHEWKDNFDRLRIESVRLTPLHPRNGSTVVATDNDIIRFSWTTPKDSPTGSHVIEIRNIVLPKSSPVRLNVLRNKGQSLNLPLSLLNLKSSNSTEVLWRMCAGKLVNGELFPQGPWSSYESFTVVPSITQRITNTGVVRIGFNTTSFGFFNVVDTNGRYKGFDQEFGSWLSRQIWENLKGPNTKSEVRVERTEYSWSDLLPAVTSSECDLVISSLTKSRQKTDRFRGLNFSDGYLDVHQIFISTKKIENGFPNLLADSSVGVQKGTINSDAAKAILSKFRFKLVELETYADVYRELNSGTIDFGLVDDVLVGLNLGKTYFRFGPVLDEYLTDFYRANLDQESEAYAVAVRDKKLLNLINEILNAPEAKMFLKNLRKEWVSPDQ